jgi:hypothetical protein
MSNNEIKFSLDCPFKCCYSHYFCGQMCPPSPNPQIWYCQRFRIPVSFTDIAEYAERQSDSSWSDSSTLIQSQKSSFKSAKKWSERFLLVFSNRKLVENHCCVVWSGLPGHEKSINLFQMSPQCPWSKP